MKTVTRQERPLLDEAPLPATDKRWPGASPTGGQLLVEERKASARPTKFGPG